MANRKSGDAWDACKDVQTAEGAALRSLFDSSPFKVLVNAHVKEQSTRDRDVCEAVIEHIAANYLFAVNAHKTFVSAPLRDRMVDMVTRPIDAFVAPDGDVPLAMWVNLGGPIDRSGGDAVFILALMSQMTDEQRAETIARICARYCAGCGTSNEPSMCQCRNDE